MFRIVLTERLGALSKQILMMIHSFGMIEFTLFQLHERLDFLLWRKSSFVFGRCDA
jgi:hypothetical protein